MLCFPGSGECPSEPQSLLCTGGVLSASPAFVPRGSSSSAQRSNLIRGGPARFSLSGERCRGVAASGQSEGNPRSSCVALCGPPLALVVHCAGPSTLVGVIIITVIVSTPLSSSRPAYTVTAGTGAVTTACSSCCTTVTASCRLLAWLAPARASCTTRRLLGCSGPVCQLNTVAVRGIFIL